MSADGGTTVRAAVLRGVGRPFEVEDIALEPVGPRYVRVKMAASGVCHSDLSVQNGSLPFAFPTVLGHEGSGVVAEVGADVTRVAVGDHVVLTWIPPCRQCFWCLHGQPMLCSVGMGESIGGPYGSVGGQRLIRGLGTATFAEQTLVPEAQVVKVDAAAPLDLAALVGCALSTGIGAVWHTAAVEPGATVAVIGCGGVGLSVIQGARLAGASTIVAIDHMAAKLTAATAMGATHAVDSSADDPVAAVMALTADRGTDYAFEVVGKAPTIRLAFTVARRGGTAVLVGAGSPAEEVSFSAFELFVGAKTMVGCVYGSTDPDRDFPAMVAMVADGTIDGQGMVSRRIALDDINDGFRAMEAGEVVRSVIVFDG
ncbi:MAG: Zn-dependent alcohol dehydrogenase [Acidimicrobiales bacterium]